MRVDTDNHLVSSFQVAADKIDQGAVVYRIADFDGRWEVEDNLLLACRVPRINDSVYTCVPTPGQLFTNQWGDAPDWFLMPEGVFGATRTITPWPADCPYYPDSPEHYQPQEEEEARASRT